MEPRWRLRTRALDLGSGVIMGVVNVTPDSFSDGGLLLDAGQAVEAGVRMVGEGADLVDVGGESTRPGSSPVSVDEELRRVLPVVEGLVARDVAVSVDTAKTEVARRALEAGAEVVNDTTAARSPGMGELIAETGAGCVLMHMKGTPRTMQDDPRYDDVVAEVAGFLAERAEAMARLGVDPQRVAIDPGIGFGKTVEHNLDLIHHLDRLAALGHPLVLGASRKSFLGRVTGIGDAAARDGVTAVTTALGFERGARVFRVHDVAASRAALRLAAAIVTPQRWDEWSPD